MKVIKFLLLTLFVIAYTFFSGIFLFYLILPTPPFPSNPPDSLESTERGDTEDYKNRRAYFTDLSREEVLAYHEEELSTISWRGFNITIPTYRLNYPPEDAAIFIKELTRSVFLEEIVHPFRESFFVNGFVAKEPKDEIIIEGREFQQKITVRYYRSNSYVRVSLAILSLGLLLLVIREWYKTIFRTNGNS